MIYGLNVAPSVIDQLTRPIVRHLHSRGIRFSLMCDDGLTVANSKSRAGQSVTMSLRPRCLGRCIAPLMTY